MHESGDFVEDVLLWSGECWVTVGWVRELKDDAVVDLEEELDTGCEGWVT